jgi:tetratricopeptide (TPR) repeat protein
MRAIQERIEALLAEIDAGPRSSRSDAAGRARIDEAIARADEYGLEELGYAARLRLLPWASRSGDTEAQLSAFAWCVGHHTADPDRVPLRIGGDDQLWFHKHVITALTGSPLFSVDDLEAAIEAMQEQYRRAGVGQSAVWQARFQATLGLGRPERAAGMLRALRRTPRDAYSHCAVCSRAEEAEFHYLTGDDQAGLALAEEILEDELSCGDEPANTIAQALLPMLRAGRPDEARRLHLRGYRMARSNPDNLRMIAQHLRFCAVTGNEAQGLEILEQHLRWLTHDGLNELAHLDALSAAGVLLTAAAQAGADRQVVAAVSDRRLAEFLGLDQGPWTVLELAGVLRARAAELAARFDRRNGNDFQSRQLARDEELLNTRYDVPLTTRPSPRADIVITSLQNAASLQARAKKLRAEAENLADKDPGRALASAREGLRLALTLGHRELTVGIARFGSIAAMTMGEDEAAIEFSRTAVREAAAAELPGEPSFRLELGAALLRAGRPDEGTVEIQEAIRRLRLDAAPPADLAVALYQLGLSQAALGERRAARDSYRDAVALASTAGDHAATTRYGLALGKLLLSLDDQQGLIVLAGTVVSARHLSTESGDPAVLVGALHLLGRALGALHLGETAEKVLKEALHTVEFAPPTPAIRYEHADVLDSMARAIGTDRHRRGEAVQLAREAADAFVAASARSEAGRSLLMAASMLQDDRPGEALNLMERAAVLVEGRPEVLMECLDALATLQERLGRTGEAHVARAQADRLRGGYFPGRNAGLLR